ncbi:MAG: hypothetical protein KY445_11115 [Armatimonadetes bacterium]|nr:hypothetical protein [Armatimonadota bacterium]
MTEPQFPPEIEAGLRGCAPVLPPALKSRTLTNCAARAEAQQKRQQRLHWQMTWAVAGVLAVQLLTLGQLDAQNARLIAGNGAAPVFAPASIAEVKELLQERSRQLALLMEPSQTS